ncbi:MAG: LysR family transcriptional regulator, partial [Paracoccaceae bacterium]
RIAHRCATLELMRSFAANGLGVGLSYSQPVPRQSLDGKGLVVLPLTDAGKEPLVLARPANAVEPVDLPQLQELLSAILRRIA